MNIFCCFLGGSPCGSPTRFHFGATEGYCFLWTLYKHLINMLGFLAGFEINSCLGATQLWLFYRSLHSSFLNCTNLPGDTWDPVCWYQWYLWKDGMQFVTSFLASFQTLETWQEQHQAGPGWGVGITDEIVRFLFAGAYFSSTAVFIVVEWSCSMAQQVARSFLELHWQKIELQHQESVASILDGKTVFFSRYVQSVPLT